MFNLSPKNADCCKTALARANCGTSRRLRTMSFCGSLALMVVLAAMAQSGQQPGGALRTDKINLPTPINQIPDANVQMAMLGTSAPPASPVDLNAMRRKQIADESSQLLSLAIALKTDVDKTSKDTLSVSVIRKADQIEKLARTVKERMKFVPGKN